MGFGLEGFGLETLTTGEPAGTRDGKLPDIVKACGEELAIRGIAGEAGEPHAVREALSLSMRSFSSLCEKTRMAQKRGPRRAAYVC
jgi:hypothetical protein